MTSIHRISVYLYLHLSFLSCGFKPSTAANATTAITASVDDLHRAAADAFYLKRPNDALQYLSEAMEIEPNNPSLLNTAGVVFKSNGEIDRAAEFFAASLKHDPASFSANYNAANLMHFDVYNKDVNNINALDTSIQYYQNAFETMLLISSPSSSSSLNTTTESQVTISKEEQIAFLNDANIALKKKSQDSEANELMTKILKFASELGLELDNDGNTNLANHDDDDTVIFGMTFDHRKPGTEEVSSVRIEMKKSDHPIEMANELQAQLGLDLLTYRWLHYTFQHAVARLNEAKILEVPIEIDGQTSSSIDIHYGDDLFALTRSFMFLQGLSSSEIADRIYQHLVSQVPQHTEMEWVNTRKYQITSALKPKVGSERHNSIQDYLSASRENIQSSKHCKVTLAIATSGRLDFFYNLVQKFPSTDLICEIIVLDYLSSAADRITMVKEFPQFQFVFLAEQERGHAHILNRMIKLAKSKYLLYLNDAWEPFQDSGERIQKAYSLMEVAGTLGMPIVQVLMNEQSISQCSLGTDLTKCRNDKLYGKAGWLRTVTINGTSFDFLEHEFGVQYLEHQISSFWPGFSSHHPALWNLNLITSDAGHVFNEDHAEYDTIFSLQLMESGLTTVHLPDVGFRYIGQ